MLLLPLLTAGMGGTPCARMTLGWGLALSWAGEGSGGTQPSAQWGHGATKMGTWVRATPCVKLREAGVMEPLQVGGIGCNKIKASMVKEGWRNLPSCCPQLVSASSVPPQPHLAHPGMPLLGSPHGSCTVPGPGGSKQLLAPAALGATWLPPCGSSGHHAGCQRPPAKARQEPAVPPGR